MSEVISLDAVMAASGVSFGTSGARGLVSAMTDRVCFIYVSAFLQYLRQLGEFPSGKSMAFAGDLRTSTPRILVACWKAIKAQGGVPVFCGYIPTPTLAAFAFSRGMPSLMVTGSHIPDDRNGIKFYRRAGEVLKSDEQGMRQQQVAVPPDLFSDDGGFARDPGFWPEPGVDAVTPYLQRYLEFFGRDALSGLRIGVYQHSAVGADILVQILEVLGAAVTALGRSECFVPVDTEAVRVEDVELAKRWVLALGLDAIVSTDGDSDRPLLGDETGQWLRGDVLGILCAQFLGAHCVVTPVSSNTALERSRYFSRVIRTRIGSPYVIEAMQQVLCDGDEPVCGYEANGGFLLGSTIRGPLGTLSPLLTRDAVLPLVAVLAMAKSKGVSVGKLLEGLPPRYTHSDRIQNFPTSASEVILADLSQGDEANQKEAFAMRFAGIVHGSPVVALDTTDGLRATFANGEIIHLRPSGNAPELRCYTEAPDPSRAAALNREVLLELRDWQGREVAWGR